MSLWKAADHKLLVKSSLRHRLFHQSEHERDFHGFSRQDGSSMLWKLPKWTRDIHGRLLSKRKAKLIQEEHKVWDERSHWWPHWLEFSCPRLLGPAELIKKLQICPGGGVPWGCVYCQKWRLAGTRHRCFGCQLATCCYCYPIYFLIWFFILDGGKCQSETKLFRIKGIMGFAFVSQDHKPIENKFKGEAEGAVGSPIWLTSFEGKRLKVKKLLKSLEWSAWKFVP